MDSLLRVSIEPLHLTDRPVPGRAPKLG